MKKQYLVKITRGNGNTENAYMRFTHSKRRYADTLEEVQKTIDYCYNEYTTKDIDKVTTNYGGCIGISCKLDIDTYNRLKVISHTVKVREVTEWEEVNL